MPVIKLINHNETQALSEVIRIFFGQVTAEADMLFAGSDSIVLTSKISDVFENGHISTSLTKEHGKTDLAEVVTSCDGIETISAIVPATFVRRELKRQLYCQLEKLTGISFPWGSLTGVRPTQIAYEEFLKAQGDINTARQRLTEYWRLSIEKADLAIETSLAEEEVIRSVPSDSLFVYMGVPFCPSRCSYCSFISRDARRQQDHLGTYVDAMIEETKQVFSQIDRKVNGLYLGGGTPTSLCDSDFARLLEAVINFVPLKRNAEWTIEAGRPDTITESKIKLIRQAGVNRICINPQTMHDKTLIKIGRNHTVKQTIDAFHLAREHGFSHINMDLIAGLPGESPSDLLDSINQLTALQPESITLHSLAIKRSSHLQEQSDSSIRILISPHDELSRAVSVADSRLREFAYRPYYLYRQKDVIGGLENTGYARPGKSCVYNVAMMSDRFDVIGLGSGAMSKWTGGSRTIRQPNSKDLMDYQRRLSELIERKVRLFNRK